MGMPPLSRKDKSRDLPYAWYWKGEPLSRHNLKKEPIMPLDIDPRRSAAAGGYAQPPWLGRLSLASILPTRRQRGLALPLGQIGPGFFSGENLLETRRDRRGRRSAHTFESRQAPLAVWEPPPRSIAGWRCGPSSYPPQPPFHDGSRYPPGNHRSQRPPRIWLPDERDYCHNDEVTVESEYECSFDEGGSCSSDETTSTGGSYHRRRANGGGYQGCRTACCSTPNEDVLQHYDFSSSPYRLPTGGRFMAPYGERGNSRFPRRAHYGDDTSLRSF